MTTLVIVRIRNCTIKFFCCLRSTRFDIFIEHSNILSTLPKFVSYQMSDWLSEEIVHCNNLENKKKKFWKRKWLVWTQEIHFATAAWSFGLKCFFLFARREKCVQLKRDSQKWILCYKWVNVQIKDSRENTFVILLFMSLSVEFVFCVFFSQYACIKWTSWMVSVVSILNICPG